jgi:hypothetical protein
VGFGGGGSHEATIRPNLHPEKPVLLEGTAA